MEPVKSLIPALPSSFVLDKLEFTVVKLNPLAHIAWLTKGGSCVCVCGCVRALVRAFVRACKQDLSSMP